MLRSQQAFNAAVAINHMKKLQQAHSEQIMRRASIPDIIPDIQVSDLSTPTRTRKRLDPDKLDPEVSGGGARGTSHIPLPAIPIEPKSHYQALKTTQSQGTSPHAPSMAEQGKHVYLSEPANLNGFVPASEF